MDGGRKEVKYVEGIKRSKKRKAKGQMWWETKGQT